MVNESHTFKGLSYPLKTIRQVAHWVYIFHIKLYIYVCAYKYIFVCKLRSNVVGWFSRGFCMLESWMDLYQ